MTYAQYGNIEAVDYNTLIGSTTSAVANTFNATWGTGSGSAGYGQSALAQVGTGEIVDDATWSTLINNAANVALHQATTSFSSISPPTVGDTITYLNTLSTNLQLIYSQRQKASIQGSTSANVVTTTSTWTDKAIWTHTITFTGTSTAYGTINGGDAARYFFNAGGQIKMTCSHPSGTGINLLLNQLASNVGTVVLSSVTSGTATIAGTNYNGITKVGGGGNTPTILPNNGYYALTTSNASVFTQQASTGPSGYQNSFINYIVRSNGPQGVNGDTGSIITIYTTWDEVSNATPPNTGGLPVAAGSSVTCTVQFPETTYIANTWGSISISGIVATT